MYCAVTHLSCIVAGGRRRKADRVVVRRNEGPPSGCGARPDSRSTRARMTSQHHHGRTRGWWHHCSEAAAAAVDSSRGVFSRATALTAWRAARALERARELVSRPRPAVLPVEQLGTLLLWRARRICYEVEGGLLQAPATRVDLPLCRKRWDARRIVRLAWTTRHASLRLHERILRRGSSRGRANWRPHDGTLRRLAVLKMFVEHRANAVRLLR